MNKTPIRIELTPDERAELESRTRSHCLPHRDARLAGKHPRFRMHFTPVHCSWMNQVEQWFSILQRKRLTAPNFADVDELEERVLASLTEWNSRAHPFRWTAKSFDKVIAKINAAMALAA